ncbi:MAG: histidine kinase dimerization/phosphoacceptor domain -containing protein [Deltaproteobacteria bacterium]|nr:histidine kinase dimerization/phosphoacceptor domain -containing protein [Deltaproteobacteria bacterium]
MTPSGWRSVALAAGVGCALLGAAVLLGWIFDIAALRSVLPGWATMKVNTALAFLLGGLALALLQYPPTRRGAIPLAAAVLAIGGLTTAEYLTGVDLRLDQLLLPVAAPVAIVPDLQAALESPPGRMALATALAFAAAGLGLLLTAAAPRRAVVGYAARACAYAAVTIGGLALAGYAVNADFLYTWYAFGSVALHTSFGLIALGLGTLAAGQAHPWPLVSLRSDLRMAALAATMLALAAGATAVVSFAALQWEIRRALAEGLRFARDERVARIETTVELRRERGTIVATRTRLLDALRRLRDVPDDAAAHEAVADVIRSFEPHGFSAIAVTLPDGAPLASTGGFVEQPAMRAALDGAPGAELLWKDGFFLSERLPIADARGRLAELRIEQTLPSMLPSLLQSESGWASAEFVLCRLERAALRCFPTRTRDRPFTLPITPTSADQPLLVQLALAHGPGFYSGFDYRGSRVLGYAGPVGSLGLMATLKVDAAEIYAPLGRQFLLAMLLAATLAGGGALLVARWLQPIAAELERQVAARTDELRRANAETRRSEANFRALVEASAQIVWVTGADGMANEDAAAWRRFTGQSVAEWSGWGWLDALHPDDRAATEAAWRDAVAARRSFTAEYRVRHHGGDWRWTSVRAAPTYNDDGSLRGWVGMNIDIDERKKAEAALRRSHEELEARVEQRTRALAEGNAVLAANQARLAAALKEKELLVKEVHHRVKNNLQVMTSLLNLQSHTTQAPAVLAALDEARGRLASIGLLYEKLHLAPDLGQIGLGDYLRDVAQRVSEQLDRPAGRVRLTVEIDPITVNPDRAIPSGLIVNELVTNALKHAFVGRAEGRIHLAVRRTGDGGVRLSLSDDGVGLPADLDPSHSPGLGLQLVAMFAEQLDATLAVDRAGGTSWAIAFRSDA